ncbi:hypothetical protein ACMFMG_004987 [Clarireedia jacksonii]
MAINWNQATQAEGLVSIRDHSLFLTVKGPPRQANSPVVIIEAGQGESSRWWIAVQTELSKTYRVYTYDRSGLGRSEPSTRQRSAENIALELEKLLEAASVQPPYVVLGHSYGGILAREFVARNLKDIKGLMLVDANTERTYIDLNAPWSDLFAVLGDLNYFAISRLDEENQLPPIEWQAIKDEGPKGEAASDDERKHMIPSADALAERRQFESCVLGDYPVTVIKANTVTDYHRIYDAGVAAGNGTKEQQANMRALIERMPIEETIQREQLKLSRNSKWVYASEYGHNIQATAPLLVAKELKDLCEKAANVD